CLLWQHPREAIHLLCDLVRRCEQTVQGNGRCEGGENCEQRVQGQACRNQRRIVLARLLLDPEKDVAPPTGGYVARAAGVTAARGVLMVSDGSGHSSNLPRNSSPRGCNMYARRSGVGEHQPSHSRVANDCCSLGLYVVIFVRTCRIYRRYGSWAAPCHIAFGVARTLG